MSKQLCHGKLEPVWKHREGHTASSMFWSFGTVPVEFPTKRMRFTCPKCGRRVLSSVHINDDGDYLIHSLPPHKPKGWWKKEKPRRKEKSRKVR